MILSVHQPHYIPWLGYFDKIARSDRFVFLDRVQFKPREFQNRNKIRTQRGPLWLTVPVFTKGRHGQLISEVRVDNEYPWQKKHEQSLLSWYGRADHFSEHEEFFREVYARSWERLTDLNVEIIRYVAEYLGIMTPVHSESSLGPTAEGTERIIDLCRQLGCDTYLSGAGGRAYLREERFEQEGIILQYQEFTHPVYKQLYMSEQCGFMPFLSIVDLLMNEGPRSRDVLNLGG